MKEYTNEELKEIYKARRLRLAAKMRETGTGACIFIDSEEHREPALPYFTNHPTDAVFIIFSDGYSVLIPWDENLARQQAYFDKLVPYTRYKNKALDAIKAVLNVCYTHGENSKVELPPISEVLLLNCDLLFALVSELNLPDSDKSKIDNI